MSKFNNMNCCCNGEVFDLLTKDSVNCGGEVFNLLTKEAITETTV